MLLAQGETFRLIIEPTPLSKSLSTSTYARSAFEVRMRYVVWFMVFGQCVKLEVGFENLYEDCLLFDRLVRAAMSLLYWSAAALETHYTCEKDFDCSEHGR